MCQVTNSPFVSAWITYSKINPKFRHPNAQHRVAGSGIVPLILIACAIWRCVVIFTSGAALSPKELPLLTE
jgi:hypothetical protein